MKYEKFIELMGELSYDEELKAIYGSSEGDITDFKHSKSSNFEVGDRVKKVNALKIDLYETPTNTEGILLTSIFIDELCDHLSLVKFENMEHLVMTRESKLELIEKIIEE